jgi:PKD repeat protein
MSFRPPARSVVRFLVLSLALGACDRDTDLVTGPQTTPPPSESELIRSDALSATTQRGGIPFGSAELWQGATIPSGSGVFNASDNYTDAVTVVRQIEGARAANHRLILNMTGGRHEKYKTNGKFDLAKWKAVMNTYDSPAVKAAVGAGVADGTIIMNSVMDEPNVLDWGGVMTKPLLDEMAAYVKRLFPTLPVAVSVRYDWRQQEHYRVVDAILSNYRWIKGDVNAYRSAALAMAKQDGIAIAFSLNVLDGGILDWIKKDCPIGPTAGFGTYSPACRMTADQVRSWGRTLGVAGCAMIMWRYEPEYMAKAENQRAFQDVAATLGELPVKPCRRPGSTPPANSRPTAAFTLPSCTAGAACRFNDGSSDADGRIARRRWDFGNGVTSAEISPSISYAAQGTYTVTLTVTDDAGASDVLARSLTVKPAGNTSPVAAFSNRPCTVRVACSFTDASTSPNGTIATWRWDFGDGTTSTRSNPTHAFDAAGSYRVALTVTDASGRTSSVTKNLVVTVSGGLPPVAAFAAPKCTAGVACHFQDASSDPDGTIVNRRWQLGNGSNSTAKEPSVIYPAVRSYSVTLTVTDNTGKSSFVTRLISVSPPAVTPVRLSLSASVNENRQYVLATWSGLTGSSVEIYRDGVLLMTTPNDGHVNTIVPRGGSTYTYKVCERGKSRCSAPVSIALPAIALTATAGVKEPGILAVTLAWAGATGATVDVYRNGARVASTPNTGRYTNIRPTGTATYAYKVCVAATTNCSKTATVAIP